MGRVTIGCVNSHQDTPSDGTEPSRIASFSAGAAIVLLLSAITLAVWSRLDAEFGLIGDAAPPSDVDEHPWNSATFLSVAAAVVAVLLLITLQRTMRSRAAALPPRWASVGVVAVCALVFLAAFSTGVPGYFRDVMSEGPITAALPAAVGAWVLAMAGAVATVFAGFGLPWWTRRVKSTLVVGVVVAVVVSGAVATAAGFIGNDARFVDATTAERVDVPAYPAALGEHKFSVKLPGALSASAAPKYQIWPAGAGFVLTHAGAVTAYGADGQERWHYRRTGPGTAAISAQVYDEGATVVVADLGAAPSDSRHPEYVLVGLDATTGDRLWTRRDARLTSAFLNKSGLYDPSPFLIYRTDETWTRFDARTGEPMWSVANPSGDCKEQRTADTGNRLASLLWCEREKDGHHVVDQKIVAADPQNGEKFWEHTYLPDVSLDDDSWRDYSVYPYPTGSAGLYLRVDANEPHRANDFYVDPGRKLVVPLPPPVAAQPTPAPAEDFLVSHRDFKRTWDVLSMYGSDGKPKCTTTTPLEAAGSLLPDRGQSEVGYVVLRDGFVVYDFGPDSRYDENSFLRMFSNTTCQPVSEVPFSAILGLVSAPGVLLALRQDVPDMETVVIDGYA